MTEKQAPMNRLAHEASPYLQQHAQQPVDWYPWGEEALEKARAENKPILLSIGYSSCHWCHVMAHESFDDTTVARIMNTSFVNIKLDREERPDIDQIYMDAVQAMGLNGGWPLNVFLTPDQKPFYGGTYFPKDRWMKLLQSITEAYANNYDKLRQSAEQFAEHLQSSEVLKYGLGKNLLDLEASQFDSAVERLSARFDHEWGGMKKAPKFPLPCVWEALALHAWLNADEATRQHLLFTLDKMAQGGIYDQIGGGFARYSVDGEWHVPHFEKMLYDNGQLLSLYAIGYQISGKSTYKNVLLETAQWLQREMQDPSGGFYSALDADSEGEEGTFYVWTADEFHQLAGDNASWLTDYFNITDSGNWEDGRNVLRRLADDESFMQKWKLDTPVFTQSLSDFKASAFAWREHRTRPGLDDKMIAGWNGLALRGLCMAYQATQEPVFEELARKNVDFIRTALVVDGELVRLAGGKTRAFLEDYAAVIQGLIAFYEISFDESILLLAADLTHQTLDQFYDEQEKLFFFTSNTSESLIARKKELFDNVIPASNSIMANNLYKLGIMLDNEWKALSQEIVRQVNPLILQEPEYLSGWAITSLMMSAPTAEVIIVGDSASEFAAKLSRPYLPNKVMMATHSTSELPLFAYKSSEPGTTTVYVCYQKTCKRPVTEMAEALELLFATNQPQ